MCLFGHKYETQTIDRKICRICSKCNKTLKYVEASFSGFDRKFVPEHWEIIKTKKLKRGKNI